MAEFGFVLLNMVKTLHVTVCHLTGVSFLALFLLDQWADIGLVNAIDAPSVRHVMVKLALFHIVGRIIRARLSFEINQFEVSDCNISFFLEREEK